VGDQNAFEKLADLPTNDWDSFFVDLLEGVWPALETLCCDHDHLHGHPMTDLSSIQEFFK